MAIFKQFDSNQKDRSAEDRRRHKQLVEESIKKNIGNIIAEESIMGQNKGKKIKIPIKSVKEYQFIYGKNSPGVGSGNGGESRGDKVGQGKQKGEGPGEGTAGNQEGEDIFETEVTIEELIQYLFDDMDLPDIDRKKIAEIESRSNSKNKGYQKKGIPPRLAKKRSAMERIKRKQGCMRNRAQNSEDDQLVEKPRFPFTEDDLRYRRIKEDFKKDFNAVIMCIMDVSGSMDQTKKYLARSFYFLLYQFIRMKYENVEVVFISHTTTAKEVSEDEFFHKGESGGTYISSGYEKCLEIIEQRYNPASWNIYAFHCSDGDNWSEDNKKAMESAKKLCDVCNLFGYGEIIPGSFYYGATIKDELEKNITDKNFTVVTITKKEDVLPGLKKLLEKDKVG